MPSSNRNPFLFVVGCPRSGTTLLQRMLDSHPQLAVSNDTHFIPRVLKEEINPRLTENLVEKVCNYKRFPRLGLSEAVVKEIAAGSGDFREFVSGLYSEFATMHGKEIGGEKTPDYVKHIGLLHRLSPWSKFIHIFRDGRDVALSMLQWAVRDGVARGPAKFGLWRENPMAVCALFWRWQVSRGLLQANMLPPGFYLEVRYESLVSDSERNLRSVAAFLDLPFSSKMVHYYEGKIRPEKNLSAKSAWLPPTSGLRNWRVEMPKKDVELFEAISGDLLEQLAYERRYKTISKEIAREAEHFCRLFDEEVQTRRVHALDLSV